MLGMKIIPSVFTEEILNIDLSQIVGHFNFFQDDLPIYKMILKCDFLLENKNQHGALIINSFCRFFGNNNRTNPNP